MKTRNKSLTGQNRLWLKRGRSFNSLLGQINKKILSIPTELTEQKKSSLTQMVFEEHCRHLREHRYYLWLKNVEALLTLESSRNPLNGPMTKLLMSIDYRKLYEALLFQSHYYLTRACFCMLAKHYQINICRPALEHELTYSLDQIKELLETNAGLDKQSDFADLFLHAYRSALIDLCLYHDVQADIGAAPLFDFKNLLSKRFSVSVNHKKTHHQTNVKTKEL